MEVSRNSIVRDERGRAARGARRVAAVGVFVSGLFAVLCGSCFDDTTALLDEQAQRARDDANDADATPRDLAAAAENPLLGTRGDLKGAKRRGHPERIVSLGLGFDEMLLALVGPTRMLAVSRFADKEDLSNVAEVARQIRYRASVDAEKILSWQPDLVVASTFDSPDAIQMLRDAGLRVVTLPAAMTLPDIREAVQTLGEATGEVERAQAMLGWMTRVTDWVAERVKDEAVQPAVYFAPNWGMVAGEGLYVDELMGIARVRNEAREWGNDIWVRGWLETVLIREPSAILTPTYEVANRNVDFVADGQRQALSAHPLWRTLRAVRENRVYAVPGKVAISSSHLAVRAAAYFARALHPTVFVGETPPQGELPAWILAPQFE